MQLTPIVLVVKCIILSASNIFNAFMCEIWVNGWLFMQVLLLMSTALNLPIPKPPPSNDLGGTFTADLRSRQQRIAEITEMIHVSSLEKFLLLSK